MSKKFLKNKTVHFVEEFTGSSNTEVSNILLEDIDLKNTQYEYRLDPDIKPLVKSLKEDGQQIPVLIKSEKPHQIICGFRRVRGLASLDAKTVKAIVISDISEEQAHRLSVIENEIRKDLTDLDRANACKRLHDEGKSQTEVATILGCSQAKVSRYLGLLSLPELIFEALKKRHITTVHAYILKPVVDTLSPDFLSGLIKEIEEKQLSTRELGKRLKQQETREKPVSRPSFFRRTGKGFRISGFTYKPDLPWEEKEKVYEGLMEAASLLRKELNPESEGVKNG